MRLTLINPETTNVNLIKEGAIPYYLFKNFGYDVTIVAYKSGDYPYAETLVKGINLTFIDRPTTLLGKNARSLMNVLLGPVVNYLKNNSQKIDILYLTGFSKESLIYSFIYKKYNKNGLVYVKADTDYGIVYIDYLRSRVKRNLLKYFFNKVDFYSVESSQVLKELQEKYPTTLTGLIPRPIPYLFFGPFSSKKIIKKDKIILTVARLGSHEKNTELLIRAFMKMDKRDWSLALVGSYDKGFYEWISNIFDKKPDFKERIHLVGNLTNREELFDWYRKSAIFCLPSRHESFGIALLEASVYGCFPITTGVREMPAAFDITDNWKFGKKFI
jgi:glycosyltransferase involved in cell wall biosynthesis